STSEVLDICLAWLGTLSNRGVDLISIIVRNLCELPSRQPNICFLGSVVFPALALASVQTQLQPSKFLAEAQAKQLNPAVSLSNLPALAPNQPKHSASLLVEEQTKQPATADNSTPLPNPADNQTQLPPPSTSQLQQSSPEQPQTPANNNTDKLFETIFGQPKTREHIAQVVVPFFYQRATIR
ncbi:hypothetical protein, partial [Nostoc sp. 'Peltigera malacea cyanobiont' DB3992]|uniref:hypothetical protein n=1 Tax=Nostoc sp. 'Peltigera malacea cyanobiont' DB3992 TaxID=1206980 RepID=UPI000C060E6A